MKLCACGCGGIVHRERSKFLLGHCNIGKKYSEERKAKIGLANSKPKAEVICWYCQKTFLVRNYRKDTAKFCSGSCRSKYSLANAVEAGLQSKGREPWNKGKTGYKSPGSGFKKGNVPWNVGTKKPLPISAKISSAISCAVRRMAKGKKNYTKWQEIVGWNFKDFKKHFAKLLKPGMTWENHGSVWHIDHIIPITAFNIVSVDCLDFKRCWKLKNLQPLFITDNISKSNKLEEPFQPSLGI